MHSCGTTGEQRDEGCVHGFAFVSFGQTLAMRLVIARNFGSPLHNRELEMDRLLHAIRRLRNNLWYSTSGHRL